MKGAARSLAGIVEFLLGARGAGNGMTLTRGSGLAAREGDAHGALSARGWAAGAGWWGQARSGGGRRGRERAAERSARAEALAGGPEAR